MLRECEVANRAEHDLSCAAMVPLLMTTFGKLNPSAQGFLQSSS